MKLIIFDFDGTLVDTAPDIVIASNIFLEKMGISTVSPEFIRSCIGEGIISLAEKVFPPDQFSEHDWLKLYNEDFLRIYDEHYLNNPRPYEGVEHFLENTESKIAIASNKKERYIHSILEHLGFDRFDWVDIIGADTLEEKKPHPLPLETILEKAKVSADEAIMIGDGYPDVGAANSVGMKCFAVEYGYTEHEKLVEKGAADTLKSFMELDSLIKRHF